MTRVLLFMCTMVFVAFSAGCSTKSSIVGLNPEIQVSQSEKFASGNVVDKSGYVFGEKDEKIVLTEVMQSALSSALETGGIRGTGYVIDTEILEYAPGNAFARWMLPGAGATKLTTVSTIYTADRRELARIPVTRSIAAGGGYTIGAWKYVFKDVAKETVKVIKEQILKIEKPKQADKEI